MTVGNGVMTIPLRSFYYIRHGETDWNREHRFMGHKIVPLNPRGVDQAHAAAHHLKDRGIQRIVHSPLIRAQQTAEILSSYLRVPLEPNDNLKEVQWGIMEGQVVLDEPKLFRDWMNGITPQGAEDLPTFRERILTGIREALEPEPLTLIVSHSIVYWAMMEALDHPNCKSANCVPYFFRPPEKPRVPWFVCALGDEPPS